MMSNVEDAVPILIEYGNQRKVINVTQKDDLLNFEQKIKERFEFDADHMRIVQIQWFDDHFKKFIDLDHGSWLKYATILRNCENNVDIGRREPLRLVHKQSFQREHNTEETINRENDASSPLSNSYEVILNMPAHHTSGITEHKIGSQIEHMSQSIHTDWFLNCLGWFLPLAAVLAFVGDGVWIICAFDPDSEEQHNYAGLVSTILLLFYYLQYDVKLDATHPNIYILYQIALLVGILSGDGLYAYYYGGCRKNIFLMVIFILYAFVDSAFVITVGYLKRFGKYRVSMGLSIHNLFHLMSRLEVLLIVLIPIFSTYDVISTNSIAFFILYEFFSHSYNNPDLIYSGCSRSSFWLLIILATTTVICENFEFVYDRYQQNAKDPSEEKRYEKLSHRFQYASNVSELCASVACYALLLLQFFSKSDKQQRQTDNNRELQTN